MTLTHTDDKGIVIKVDGKDLSEAMDKLLKEKGITHYTELHPAIAEATWNIQQAKTVTMDKNVKIDIQQITCNVVVCGVPDEVQKQEIKQEIIALLKGIKEDARVI